MSLKSVIIHHLNLKCNTVVISIISVGYTPVYVHTLLASYIPSRSPAVGQLSCS
jgi:hypothetical protein